MLTRRGWAILGLVALIYVLADATGIRLLYLMFASLSLVYLVSALQIKRSPRGLMASRTLRPSPCTEGTLVGVETVTSGKGPISGLILSMDDVLSPELELEEAPTSSGSTKGYLVKRYRIRAGKRGLFPVGPLNATLTDVFGLMTSSCIVGEESKLMVYPSQVPMEVARGRESSEMLGVTTTTQKGTSSDFLRIRSYEPGDEVKTIHWRSSAKLGKLMVRELEKEETRSTTIFLNCEEYSNRGKEDIFELGVRIAASISVSALKMNMDVKLILNEDEPRVVQKGRGAVHYHRLLSALATVKPNGRTSMSSLLGSVLMEAGVGGTLHIISPTLQEKDTDRLAYLMRRGMGTSLILTSSHKDPGISQLAIQRIIGLGGKVAFAEARSHGRVVVKFLG